MSRRNKTWRAPSYHKAKKSYCRVESALDFCSPSFDPVRALRAKHLAPPRPKVKVFQTLEEYLVALKQSPLAGEILTGVECTSLLRSERKTKQDAKPKSAESRQERLERFQQITRTGVTATVECDYEDRSVRTVLQRMQDYDAGPFTLLRKCAEEGIKLRVWTRKQRGIGGVCCGHLIAFDKHMNLAMMDVEELFTVEEAITRECVVEDRKCVVAEKKRQKKKTQRQKKRIMAGPLPCGEHPWLDQVKEEDKSQTSNVVIVGGTPKCTETKALTSLGSGSSVYPNCGTEIEPSKHPIAASVLCPGVASKGKSTISCETETVQKPKVDAIAATPLLPNLSVDLIQSLSTFIRENPQVAKIAATTADDVAKQHKAKCKTSLRSHPVLIPPHAEVALTDPRTAAPASRVVMAKAAAQGGDLHILDFHYSQLGPNSRMKLHSQQTRSRPLATVHNHLDAGLLPCAPGRVQCEQQPASPMDCKEEFNNPRCTGTESASGDSIAVSNDCGMHPETWAKSKLLRERPVYYRHPVAMVKERRHLKQVLIRGDSVVMVSYEK